MKFVSFNLLFFSLSFFLSFYFYLPRLPAPVRSLSADNALFPIPAVAALLRFRRKHVIRIFFFFSLFRLEILIRFVLDARFQLNTFVSFLQIIIIKKKTLP